jgi:hypothetical protein
MMLLALARFLHGGTFPGWASRASSNRPPFLNLLPRGMRERLFARLGAGEGVAPEAVGRVSTTAIAEWAAGLYPRRRYLAVMIGSSSGAVVHLGAALGIPWLPQTFLTLVCQAGVHPGDAVRAMEAGQGGRHSTSSPPTRTFNCTTCTTRARTG